MLSDFNTVKMDNHALSALLLKNRIDPSRFNDILFDYQHYQAFDARLFDDNGQLNKHRNLLPIDKTRYDKSILNLLRRIDQTVDGINKHRAVLFPLFAGQSPLTNERLRFQLDVLLVPLLDISNRILEHYYHRDPHSTNKKRQQLAAELHSIVKFLQAAGNDMQRYRELSLLESNIMDDIAAHRGYLTLHETITSQTPMELDEENHDFHDMYLHDRLLSYRHKALNNALHKLYAEREKQQRLIDKALTEFEQQYRAEIRNRTNIIRTLNGYLGDTFLSEIQRGNRYEVLPSGRRNVAFSKYLNVLLPLYNTLRKLAIENDIFDTLQALAKRSFLANAHN